MKTKAFLVCISILIIGYTNIYAQDSCAKHNSINIQLSTNKAVKQQTSKVQTEKFSVKGNCEMCKARIENAALIQGVKSAEWDKSTKIITVIYNPQKVSLQTIHKSIADAGHETSLMHANMNAYNKFPACCAYLKDGNSGCGHTH